MKYCSTRGGVEEKDLSFQKVLFAGYASDGGLYVPSRIPHVSIETLEEWRSLPYPQLLTRVLRLYIDAEEIPDRDITDIIKVAFQNFENPDSVIPIAQLKNGLSVAELFHGPTLAFKDFAMSVVSRLLQYFLKLKQQRLTILVGTSGDTGGAAIHALKDIPEIQLLVLYPDKRCSEMQELQMTTVVRPNIHVFNVEGSSDDLDVPIKYLLLDKNLKKEFQLTSINSINWGRILVQVAHFIFIYLQCSKHYPETVNIIVPSGAAGNLAAGILAKRMGIPINLIASLNENETLRHLVDDGILSFNEKAVETHASAMDIQVPYNVERLLYFATSDPEAVAYYMRQLEEKKLVLLPRKIKEQIQQFVAGAYSFNDKEIAETIARCWKEDKYYICPHTATAVAYYYCRKATREVNEVYACLATASIAKFPTACVAAKVPTAGTAKIATLKCMPTYKICLHRVPGDDTSLQNSFRKWQEELHSYIRKLYDEPKLE